MGEDWAIIARGAMIPGLQAKHYDMIAAGLYSNPKRCKAIAFSVLPRLQAGLASRN